MNGIEYPQIIEFEETQKERLKAFRHHAADVIHLLTSSHFHLAMAAVSAEARKQFQVCVCV